LVDHDFAITIIPGQDGCPSLFQSKITALLADLDLTARRAAITTKNEQGEL
jgi:hypothetical protein